MFKTQSLFPFFLAAGAVLAHAQQVRTSIGRPATAKQIQSHGISVAPDGTGLPAGHGTALQGRSIYLASCAACHGKRGQGITGMPALVGGHGTLTTDKPFATVGSYWPYSTTLWDYIHRAMPYQNPGSLTSNQVYSVTAYILFMNKIIGKNEELNKETLPKVKMPNRNGFVPDARPDVK